MPDPGVLLAIKRGRPGRLPVGTIEDHENTLDLVSPGNPHNTTLEPPWAQ